MSRTSLGLASEGLLDRGQKPALHIATLGHLREIEITDETGGGGGYISPYRMPVIDGTPDTTNRRLAFILLLAG